MPFWNRARTRTRHRIARKRKLSRRRQGARLPRRLHRLRSFFSSCPECLRHKIREMPGTNRIRRQMRQETGGSMTIPNVSRRFETLRYSCDMLPNAATTTGFNPRRMDSSRIYSADFMRYFVLLLRLARPDQERRNVVLRHGLPADSQSSKEVTLGHFSSISMKTYSPSLALITSCSTPSLRK